MSAPRAFSLIAELTHRCPLHCPYCSNPIELTDRRAELPTDQWQRVLREAEALGIVQVHFTGGEPLLRADLETLVRDARSLGMYSNLITSGIPLTRRRLAALADAGIDHVQLSLQDVSADASERIAGTRSFDAKLEAARWIKDLRLAFTLNVVLHRGNLDHVEEIVALAERLRADRLELANTQYHGWAFPNRAALLPTRQQLDRALETAQRERRRLSGRMEIFYVTPDYYSDSPKPCMNGWGRSSIVVAPDGLALPCHAARALPGFDWEDVRARSLQQIWEDSPGFNRFRGAEWMPEPCRNCPRKTLDFGGCRCQAYQLTGNAAATDPACALSPHHSLIEKARAQQSAEVFVYRRALREARPPVTASNQGQDIGQDLQDEQD